MLLRRYDAAWMKSNRLNLNASKTQFIRCATSRRQGRLSTAPIEFCGEKIHPETSVRNLGVITDSAIQEQIESSLHLMDHFFPFSFISSAGALKLDSILQGLRN